MGMATVFLPPEASTVGGIVDQAGPAAVRPMFVKGVQILPTVS
jgi:hypothetical protein